MAAKIHVWRCHGILLWHHILVWSMLMIPGHCRKPRTPPAIQPVVCRMLMLGTLATRKKIGRIECFLVSASLWGSTTVYPPEAWGASYRGSRLWQRGCFASEGCRSTCWRGSGWGWCPSCENWHGPRTLPCLPCDAQRAVSRAATGSQKGPGTIVMCVHSARSTGTNNITIITAKRIVDRQT